MPNFHLILALWPFICHSASMCCTDRKVLAANKPARQPHLWLGRDFMLPRAVSWPCLAGSTLCVLLVLNLAGHIHQLELKLRYWRGEGAISGCGRGRFHSGVSHTQGGPEFSAPRLCSSALEPPKAAWGIVLQSCKMHGLEQQHEAAQAGCFWSGCRVSWQSQALQPSFSKIQEYSHALIMMHCKRRACRGGSIA